MLIFSAIGINRSENLRAIRKDRKIVEHEDADNVVNLSNLVLRKTQGLRRHLNLLHPMIQSFFRSVMSSVKNWGSKEVKSRVKQVLTEQVTSASDSNKIVDKHSGASELAEKLSKRLDSMKSIKEARRFG